MPRGGRCLSSSRLHSASAQPRGAAGGARAVRRQRHQASRSLRSASTCRASQIAVPREPTGELDDEAPTDSGDNNSGGADDNGGSKSTAEDEPDFNYHGWNPFKRVYVGILSRAAADPDFFYKVSVECGIDAIIIASVNWGARGESFFDELEFVFCQMLVSCSNDFALVYLLSPTVGSAPVATTWLQRGLQKLPPHVFASGLYTATQRASCFLWKALQYGIIGFSMGLAGSFAVNRMTDVRELTDEKFEPPGEAPSAILTGLGWLYFMGINSNLRYNLVAAGEQFLYRRHPGAVSKLGSVGMRLVNNFVGAYQWVDLADEIGVSQPRKSLREERRRRARRERRAKWMWWKRREPEPRWWPFSLFQSR